jgi:excisionase family DNA binding protein
VSKYEVLTDKELADEWKVGIRNVQKLLRTGRLRGFHVGDKWRITREAANDYANGKAEP